MPHDPTLLRTRADNEHHKVTYVELFFDLVFVFAVTQISHTLIVHFTPLGALQAALLTVAVWWVWIFTSWVTNWVDPEKLPVRIAMFTLMILGAILSASIPHAFDSRGIAFAGAYVLMQVGRSAFVIWASKGHQAMTRNFTRILIWTTASGVFWIAGAFTHDGSRLALWSIALLLELISPSLFFWVPGLGRSTSSDWNVEGSHMAERCGLFIIIALGESILVTGATFSGLQWTTSTFAAFVISLVGSIAMWWLYFDIGAGAGSKRMIDSNNPGKLARLAYTYIHLLMVAGIILAAVSDELVLHHPHGRADTKTIVSILGSAALYLTGNMLFKWAVIGQFPFSHLAGVGALMLFIPGASFDSPLLLSAGTVLVLVLIAATERILCRRYLEMEVPKD